MLQLFIVPVKQGQSDLQDGINSLDCHDSIHFLLLHHLLSLSRSDLLLFVASSTIQVAESA